MAGVPHLRGDTLTCLRSRSLTKNRAEYYHDVAVCFHARNLEAYGSSHHETHEPTLEASPIKSQHSCELTAQGMGQVTVDEPCGMKSLQIKSSDLLHTDA